MQILAPFLEIEMLHTIEIDKALVNGIAEVGRGFLADDANYPCSQFSI